MRKRSVEYLIDASVKIEETSALEAGQIAFIPRIMATASFPVSRPEAHEFIRRNGNKTLTMLASSEIGLPYGALPRLALCAITTAAKQSQSNIISLGPSMSYFLKAMGKSSTGGKNGSLTHAREQLKRLLSCTIQITQSSDCGWEMASLQLCQHAAMLWHPTSPGEWHSTLALSAEFYHDIQHHAVPIDRRVLEACGHYPLAMDIYCWLTYRYYSLKTPTAIGWADLMNQFGNQFTRKSHFKSKFTRTLEWVAQFYLDARFEVNQKGVLLLPSPTHIPPKDLRAFLK